MILFRFNNTREPRTRLFRPVRRENGRFVLVRGQVPVRRQTVSPPVDQGTVNQCQKCDPEKQGTMSSKYCDKTCVTAVIVSFVVLGVLLLIFLIFSIVALAAFFYREDISTTEKWEYLTG